MLPCDARVMFFLLVVVVKISRDEILGGGKNEEERTKKLCLMLISLLSCVSISSRVRASNRFPLPCDIQCDFIFHEMCSPV